MNIVILGSGAIGSLFGAKFSKNNHVTLIGRKPHIDAVQKNNLNIIGRTTLKTKIKAIDTIKKITDPPDLLIISVKSFDTAKAIKEAKSIIDDKTVVLSLQNGLDNVNKISKWVENKQILAGVTTHGALFLKPGVIKHTGTGYTIIGNISKNNTKKAEGIVSIFNQAEINTRLSNSIETEIWRKTIINSSINPLTSYFKCKNGYLLENIILEKLVEKICEESTIIANKNGIDLSVDDMIKTTKKVITDTAQNKSSMLQSILQGKTTEIDSINGKLVEIGKKYKVEVFLNDLLVKLIRSI